MKDLQVFRIPNVNWVTVGQANPSHPTEPGKILACNVLPTIGKIKTEIAKLLHIWRQKLYDILDCKQLITQQLGARICKLCGNDPRL